MCFQRRSEVILKVQGEKNPSKRYRTILKPYCRRATSQFCKNAVSRIYHLASCSPKSWHLLWVSPLLGKGSQCLAAAQQGLKVQLLQLWDLRTREICVSLESTRHSKPKIHHQESPHSTSRSKAATSAARRHWMLLCWIPSCKRRLLGSTGKRELRRLP